jgi:molecular chaperone DnaK
MASNKILYGIDLGTTNSSIAKITHGDIEISKSESLKTTSPSCVHFNRKQGVSVGDSSYKQLGEDLIRAFTTPEWEINTFAEFKRTMGSDKLYPCSNLKRSLSSEDLSAEVLKYLKALTKEPVLKAVVITVPAKFTPGQKAATVKAAELAGFDYCELLQEPVAASLAYGMNSKVKDGYWVVFDLGGGTFDAALMKIEDGIMNVIDTEGDNYLGGKNLDYAIVDNIIIPFLSSNYSISRIMADADQMEKLRNAFKAKAEEAKIKLTFNETCDVITELGEELGEDDNGEALELDITISRDQYSELAAPLFQKAIDITKDLLARNNLSGPDLATLILVGGPTYTPLLKEMLSQQISPKIDSSIDPMTVVARGAALHASTIDVPEGIVEPDRSVINLELRYETSSVETREWLTVKLLQKESDFIPDEGVYLVIKRNDGFWSTEKIKLGSDVELIELNLLENATNQFEIELFDPKGNRLISSPSQLTILQGFKHGQKGATLPHQIMIEIHDELFDRDSLTPIKGLEKNKVAPVVGTENRYKTPLDLRPGNANDFVEIPIYAGDYYAEGTKAVYSNLVAVVKISGDDVPALVKANSAVNLTIKVERDEKMNFSAYFPSIDFTWERLIEFARISVPSAEDLALYIGQARTTLEGIYDETDKTKADQIFKDLEVISEKLQNALSNEDFRLQTLNDIRKLQREIDVLEKQVEIPRIEERLRHSYAQLENLLQMIRDNSLDEQLNTEKINAAMTDHKNKLNSFVNDKDRSINKLRLMKDLSNEISLMDMQLRFTLAGREICARILRDYATDFDRLEWSDRAKARALIQRGLNMPDDASERDLLSIVVQLNGLLPAYQQHKLV